MKKIMVWTIVSVARLLTAFMNPERQARVYDRTRDRLGREIPVTTSGGRRIKFYNDSDAASAIVRTTLKAETDTVAWIEAIPEDGVLWDIGANIGFFTLYAAAALGGNGVRVVAFEPGAASYGALNRNIERNGMDDRIVAYCVALAGTTRTGRLNMGSVGRGTSAGGYHNGFDTVTGLMMDDIDPVFRQGSVGFSIDDFVSIFQPPLPTHVKLDVDNIEAEILRGGWRTLSAGGSVRSMIVEMEGDLDSPRNRELFSVMAELGFAPLPKLAPELRNVVFERLGTA